MCATFVSMGFREDVSSWYQGVGLRNLPSRPICDKGTNISELILICFHYLCTLKSYHTVLLFLFFPQDINGKLFLPKYALSQDICTYGDFLYKTVEIPGCPRHVAPYFSYPVAVSCKCGKCDTDYSDCVHEAIKTNYCTKPQKFYVVEFSI